MVGIRELETLRAFVETGSVSRAAERVCRTQPQVGRILSSLEKAVGMQLFDRSCRPFGLTRVGHDYYLRALQVLSAADSLKHYAERARRSCTPSVRIFTAPFIAHALVMDPTAEITRDGSISVSIDSRVHLDIESWISGEVFDLGVVGFPIAHPAFDIEPFITVEAVAVVPSGHRLANYDAILFDDLVQENLVLLHPRSRLRRQLEQLASERGECVIRSTHEVTNGLIACQLVERGLGCCLSDPFIAMSSGVSGIVLRPFVPSIRIEYAFYYPTWQVRSVQTKAVAHAIATRAEALWAPLAFLSQARDGE